MKILIRAFISFLFTIFAYVSLQLNTIGGIKLSLFFVCIFVLIFALTDVDIKTFAADCKHELTNLKSFLVR